MVCGGRVYESELKAALRAGRGRFRRRRKIRLPEPDDRDRLGDFWSAATARAWLNAGGGFEATRFPLHWWPDATRPATLVRAIPLFGAGFDLRPRAVLQEWAATGGRVVVSWCLDGRPVPLAEVAQTVPAAAACLRVGTRWTGTGPELVSVTGADPSAAPQPCAWPDLARVLGLAAPYWPPGLRDPELIGRWRPGDPVVRHPAMTVLPVRPLLELAALHPVGHPVHRALVHTAQRISAQRAAGVPTDRELSVLRPEQISLAAVDDGCAPADPVDPPDPVIRLGWREVQNREDLLAEQCIRLVHDWDGGTPLTHPQAVTVSLRSAAGAEFAARLRSCGRRAVHALADPLGTGAPLVDPESDAPAVVPIRDPRAVRVLAPRRLASPATLGEVVLEDPVFVRDGAGTLHLAPRAPRSAYGWGGDERGRAELALLLERLLTDLTADPDALHGTPDPGLAELLGRDWAAGTVLTRDRLRAHLVP
ncbi:hypothetical protein [Amycolatopsis sp. Hca4]|uniref:hypothetical protein n=1 Tax=Amycolatopsis sp. Hca4 TaxID=2742131 RepID=UPI0015918D17|nr:hypothetical protein [Amycolatopsis sp. Hca4]QKV80456.1 hypothetical protein HUT10_46755 [Amycolatopsis sp. Hca4]